MDAIERTNEFEELVSRHKELKTDREKTEVEARLWDKATGTERKSHDRRDWLSEVLGRDNNTIYAYDMRSRLSKAPPLVWDYVEANATPLGTAVKLYNRAVKYMKSSGVDFSEAFAAIVRLTETNKISVKSTRINKEYRVSDVDLLNPSRRDWQVLYNLIDQITAPRVASLPELVRRELVGKLKIEVTDAMKTFLARLGTARKNEEDIGEVILFQRVEEACKALLLDPPPPGQPVSLKRAKEKKLAIARLNHPDASGAAANETYTRAIEAYDVLETYNRKLQAKDEANGQK